MIKSRSLSALVAVVIGLLGLLIAAGPVSAAPPLTQAAAVGEATAAGEATPGAFTLPHKTVRHADGSIEKIADPKVVADLRAAAAASACGNACDGQNPSTYIHQGSTCNDARTIYQITSPDRTAYAELRFSSRCGTAWTRSCCYVRGGGFSYNSNGTQRESVANYDGVHQSAPVWTAMLNDAGSLTYKACYDNVVAGSSHDWRCTFTY